MAGKHEDPKVMWRHQCDPKPNPWPDLVRHADQLKDGLDVER